MRHDYETPTPDPYPNPVSIKGWDGVAWHVLGEHVQGDENTIWTGIKEKTGQLVCRMVGDDRDFLIDPEDIEEPCNYCPGCGQIGCRAYL